MQKMGRNNYLSKYFKITYIAIRVVLSFSEKLGCAISEQG
jgi:hypothetical protein